MLVETLYIGHNVHFKKFPRINYVDQVMTLLFIHTLCHIYLIKLKCGTTIFILFYLIYQNHPREKKSEDFAQEHFAIGNISFSYPYINISNRLKLESLNLSFFIAFFLSYKNGLILPAIYYKLEYI